MKRIGFVVSQKENELRRALLPSDVKTVVNRKQLVFEENYAVHLGIPDQLYVDMGCSVAPRQVVYQCDIVCNPKAPEPAERDLFHQGQTLFGWVHAVQGTETVDFLLGRGMTAIAWEDMYDSGQHIFWRNNEIAGEAAVLHAINYLGRLPFGLHAALVGIGNCARGAMRVLCQLGMTVDVYDRKRSPYLRDRVGNYDVVVNAVMWDIFRDDHLIAREDLNKMKPGSMIIDISCDEHMGIESSRPTPIYDPVYVDSGVIHYVVDHTPALYWRTATEAISRAVAPYIDELVEGKPRQCLQAATAIRDGVIVDERISRFQKRVVCQSA